MMMGRRPTAPQPPLPVQPLQARDRRPAHEARAFQPSTFASRAARAAADQTAGAGVELVYLGRTHHWFMKDRRNKDVYCEGDLFFERAHPNRRWLLVDGDTALHPLFDDSQREPAPEPIGTFRRRSVLPSAFLPSGASDEPSWRP